MIRTKFGPIGPEKYYNARMYSSITIQENQALRSLSIWVLQNERRTELIAFVCATVNDRQKNKNEQEGNSVSGPLIEPNNILQSAIGLVCGRPLIP